MAAVTMPAIHSTVCPASNVEASTWSLLKNPASGGMPARARPPTANAAAVTGIGLRRPPSRVMSISPSMACMTLPAARNIRALKKAWVTRWKMPTANAPTPTARNMYPSWLIVEYANTRLRSSWPAAESAAYTAVTSPTTATANRATSDASKMGKARATRYTPAVTMVAAWIRADTGVGPSMASGSHVCSGSWADLPTAPANRRRAMTVAVDSARPSAAPNTSPNSMEPNVSKTRTIPISMALSPMRVTMNAFLPASAAAFRSYQYAIRRYEHRPTPSQPTYRRTKLFARTRVSMENTNRFMYAKNREYRGSPCM